MKLFCNDAVYYADIHQRHRNKPNLLLLHGFMGSSEGMAPLAQLLKPICNPCTIDLAGHGRSVIPADPERFKAKSQVRDLQLILDRLQLENLWLYGYSMGGRLAQCLFLDSPDQFSGMILESTQCGITDGSERQQRQITDEERAKAIESDFDSFIDRWIDLPLFKSPNGARDFDYNPIFKQQDPSRMAASLRGFGAGTAPYVCDQMAATDKPIGLIAGESDKKYVDKMHEMHHLFSFSDLHVAAGSGHRVHADQPEQIVTFLTNFLNRHG